MGSVEMDTERYRVQVSSYVDEELVHFSYRIRDNHNSLLGRLRLSLTVLRLALSLWLRGYRITWNSIIPIDLVIQPPIKER